MYIYATVMHICTSMSLLIFLSVCQILFNTRQSMNNFGKIIYMLNISFFDFYFNFHLNKSIFITYMHASFNKSFTSLLLYFFTNNSTHFQTNIFFIVLLCAIDKFPDRIYTIIKINS